MCACGHLATSSDNPQVYTIGTHPLSHVGGERRNGAGKGHQVHCVQKELCLYLVVRRKVFGPDDRRIHRRRLFSLSLSLSFSVGIAGIIIIVCTSTTRKKHSPARRAIKNTNLQTNPQEQIRLSFYTPWELWSKFICIEQHRGATPKQA